MISLIRPSGLRTDHGVRGLLHSRITLALLITVSAVEAHVEDRVLEEGILEEVVVLAQKREQPLLEVPISISTLSLEELEAAGAYSIEDISRLVPNLEVQTNVNAVQSTFRIRRVGNLGNIPTFEPAVGVFMDGAFRSRSVFAMSELFDLERVEILRGPQNTLYGKNTSAGLIGIYTRTPGETLGSTNCRPRPWTITLNC